MADIQKKFLKKKNTKIIGLDRDINTEIIEKKFKKNIQIVLCLKILNLVN